MDDSDPQRSYFFGQLHQLLRATEGGCIPIAYLHEVADCALAERDACDALLGAIGRALKNAQDPKG